MSEPSFVFKETPEWKKFKAALKQLENLEVGVGFLEEDKNDEGISLAQIAAINEYGTSTIPARPFLRQSFEQNEDEIRDVCGQAIKMVASGVEVNKALDAIGVKAVGIVQEQIVNGDFTPNAPSTIRKKKSDKPLIDTGQMRQGIHYVKRKSGGGNSQ